MTVFFDYSQSIIAVRNVLADALWTGPTITAPYEDGVLFQAPFNPGHAGATLFLEYDFAVKLFQSATAAIDLLKLQYRTSGGAWTTIVSEAAKTIATTGTNWTKSGIYTTAITLPVEIRLAATQAAGVNSLYITYFSGDADHATYPYFIYLRAVGSV